MKKESGITLIALVITIIVLLILAGVSISMVTGDNGIASKATEAKEKTNAANDEEEQKLQDALDYIDSKVEESSNSSETCPIYFGKPYTYDYGDGYTETYYFYEDGSFRLEMYSGGTLLATDVSGTFSYNGLKIINVSSGYGEKGGEYATLSEDGMQFKDFNGTIYIVDLY